MDPEKIAQRCANLCLSGSGGYSKSGSLRSRNSDAEGSTVGKLEEFESDREEVKGAGEVEIQQMGSVYLTDQVENSGLNTVEN
ncbi:hypothetical protein ACOSQ2_024666 [Xanthoceras sorbifolium]